MVIVAVDDEKPARILLENILRDVRPEAEIHIFSTPEELLEYVEKYSADIAVLANLCIWQNYTKLPHICRFWYWRLTIC